MRGNICSDVQDVWTEHSEVHALERQNKYFPYELRSLLIWPLLYNYLNKQVNDENLLC